MNYYGHWYRRSFDSYWMFDNSPDLLDFRLEINGNDVGNMIIVEMRLVLVLMPVWSVVNVMVVVVMRMLMEVEMVGFDVEIAVAFVVFVVELNNLLNL